MGNIDDLKSLIVYNGVEISIVKKLGATSEKSVGDFCSTLAFSFDVSNSILSPLFEVGSFAVDGEGDEVVRDGVKIFGFKHFIKIPREDVFFQSISVLMSNWVRELSQEYENSGLTLSTRTRVGKKSPPSGNLPPMAPNLLEHSVGLILKTKNSSLSNIEKMNRFFEEMSFEVRQKWQEKAVEQLSQICSSHKKMLNLNEKTVKQLLLYMMIYCVRNGLEFLQPKKKNSKVQHEFKFDENFGVIGNNIGINTNAIDILNRDFIQNGLFLKKEKILSMVTSDCLSFKISKDDFLKNFNGIDCQDKDFEQKFSMHYKQQCLSNLDLTLKSAGVKLLHCMPHNDLSMTDFDFDRLVLKRSMEHWRAQKETKVLGEIISKKQSSVKAPQRKRKIL